MTIRLKSILLVLVTSVLLAAVGTILVVFIVLARFAELEKRDAETAMRRLSDTLSVAEDGIRRVALQWSRWDDAYAFMEDRNPAFVAKNMVDNSTRDSNVDTIAYLDLGGNLLAEVSDRPADQGPLPAGLFTLAPDLLSDARQGRDRIGLITIDGRVYLIAAMASLDGDGKLASRGVCVLLRELTTTVISELTSPMQVPVTIAAPGREVDTSEVTMVSDSQMRCRVRLTGLDGRPAALATIELPRPVHALGRSTLRELMVAGVFALGVISILQLLLLEHSVLRRMVRLGREVDAQESDPSKRITIDGDDEIGYLAGVVERTVARSREAANRAEANQMRYRMLFQRSADAILVVDDDRIIDANRAAARLFGAPSRRALIDTPFSRLVDGSTRPTAISSSEESSVRRIAPRAGKTSSDKLIEWTMYALDGRIIQAEVREAVVELDGIEAVQVLVRDVTERRKAEGERRLLAGLIEATSDCVVVADGRGRTAFLNGAARTRLGISGTEDVSRQAVAEFFSESSRQPLSDLAMHHARAHGVWRGETELLMRDGRTFPASQVLVAVSDEEGRITHFGSLLRDISAERERESQLVRARSQAEEAARAKSSFLAIMSHELRTPLNGVIGMSSLLQESELPREHRELVDTIKLCADNLLALINDILDLSKIEAGGLDLECTRFNLRELVESAVMIIAEQAMTKGLEIGSLVGPGVPEMVEGDPTRLRQVLVNLLGNAVKFTEQGEVLVTVGPLPSDAGDGKGTVRLSFAVKDTGIGIAPDVLPRLFKPFAQADDSTTRKHGGTGLGLAISQRLVGFMGGDIHITSTPGQGSTFSFAIPLPVTRHASDEMLPDLSKATVMVVDPSPTARQIACTMLAAWGARSIEVSGIRQAVEAARSGRISAILTARQLIDGDARDLVAAIRSERTGTGIGIGLILPVFQRQKEQAVAGAGADALLVKPLRSSSVHQVVSDLVTRGPQFTPLANGPAVRTAGIAGKRVLVVEDNLTNRMLALRILEVLGLKGESVASGAEALDTLATETFDLVLMDCQMPELDGLQATRLFREREARETALMRRMNAGHLQNRAVIVAVTAHAMAGDRERCIAAGMDDYLSKPYTIDDLRKMLEHWIG